MFGGQGQRGMPGMMMGGMGGGNFSGGRRNN